MSPEPVSVSELATLVRLVIALRISRPPFPVWLIRAVAGPKNDPNRRKP